MLSILSGLYFLLEVYVSLIVIFFIGILAAIKHYKRYKEHDSSEIVIDEVVGQWVAIIFINENYAVYLDLI